MAHGGKQGIASLPQNVGFDYYGFLGVSDMYTEWRDVYFNPEVALSPERFAMMEKLVETKQLENTLLIFGSDNGPEMDEASFFVRTGCRKQRWILTSPMGSNHSSHMKVNLKTAKARLSELVESAYRGEEIWLTVRGKPKARLCPLSSGETRPDIPEWIGSLRERRVRYGGQKNSENGQEFWDNLRGE